MALPLTRSYVRRKDWDKLLDCMIQDLWAPGARCQALETEFSSFLKVAKSWSFINAASAMRYVFRGLRILPGDVVILSPLASPLWSSILNEFEAIPVYGDVLADSPVLDLESVKEKLIQNPRAIILDSALGYLPDWEAFKKLEIFLIEDFTQGIGGVRDGEAAGTWGDVVFYSLRFDSLITSGQGAMVSVRRQRHLEEFFSTEPLTDDRLGEPQAALALSLWTEKDRLVERKLDNSRALFQRLSRGHRQPRQYGEAEIVGPWFVLLPAQGAKDVISYATRRGVACEWAFATHAEKFPKTLLETIPHARYFFLHTLIFPLPSILSLKESDALGKVLSTLP